MAHGPGPPPRGTSVVSPGAGVGLGGGALPGAQSQVPFRGRAQGAGKVRAGQVEASKGTSVRGRRGSCPGGPGRRSSGRVFGKDAGSSGRRWPYRGRGRGATPGSLALLALWASQVSLWRPLGRQRPALQPMGEPHGPRELQCPPSASCVSGTTLDSGVHSEQDALGLVPRDTNYGMGRRCWDKHRL